MQLVNNTSYQSVSFVVLATRTIKTTCDGSTRIGDRLEPRKIPAPGRQLVVGRRTISIQTQYRLNSILAQFFESLKLIYIFCIA